MSIMRIQYPGAYFNVMNRGLSRRNIFLEDKDRERFLELLMRPHGSGRQRDCCVLLLVKRSRWRCIHSKSGMSSARTRRDWRGVEFRKDLLGKFSMFTDGTDGRWRQKTFGSSSAKYSATVTKEPKADLVPPRYFRTFRSPHERKFFNLLSGDSAKLAALS
jgi:hypothetical protein